MDYDSIIDFFVKKKKIPSLSQGTKNEKSKLKTVTLFQKIFEVRCSQP